MLNAIKQPASLLAIALVLTAGVVSAIALGYRARAEEPLPEWPALTMEYDVTGTFHAVGTEPPPTSTLVFLLTNDGKGNWREEIISAPDVVTRVGTFNRTGSYKAVQDGVYTEGDGLGGEVTTETVEPGTRMIPRSMLLPFPLHILDEHYDKEPTLVPTTAKVCFNDVCEENARGWLYRFGSSQHIYADDERGIPIGLSHLNIMEVHIASDQQSMVW